MIKRAAVWMLLTGAVLSTACGTRTINQVLADPTRYQNQEVKLSGAVVDSFSVVGRGAYRLEDRTGQLWIVSDTGVPRKGARVDVKGTVRDGFNFGTGSINLPAGLGSGIVLVESSHKAQ
jgi:3D (Asp-Asp-Asp) domain-containing protein